MQSVQVGQIGFDLRWLGGRVRLFQQREAVTPAVVGIGGPRFFFQQIVEPAALPLAKAVVDDLAQRVLMVADPRHNECGRHIVAGKGDLLAGQHLDDFQQDPLGSELHADQRCDFVGGEGLCRRIKRAAAEVARSAGGCYIKNDHLYDN